MQIDSLSSMHGSGPEYHRLRKAGEGDRPGAVNPQDPSVKPAFAHLLEKSLQLTPDGAEAVREARRALEAGELDRPEAIRDAAEKMLRQGI